MQQKKVQSALNEVSANSQICVAFLLNKEGGLVAWAGDSEAFSPTGHFVSMAQGEERSDNLYLTVVGEHYLGVLFKEGDPIDEIRAVVEKHEVSFKQYLGYND